MIWPFNDTKKKEDRKTDWAPIHISHHDGRQYINTNDLVKSQTFKNQLSELSRQFTDE